MLTVADSHDGATEHRKDYDETESSAVMLQRLRFLKKKKKERKKKGPCKTNHSPAVHHHHASVCVCVNTAIKRNNTLIFFGTIKGLLLQKSNSYLTRGTTMEA